MTTPRYKNRSTSRRLQRAKSTSNPRTFRSLLAEIDSLQVQISDESGREAIERNLSTVTSRLKVGLVMVDTFGRTSSAKKGRMHRQLQIRMERDNELRSEYGFVTRDKTINFMDGWPIIKDGSHPRKSVSEAVTQTTPPPEDMTSIANKATELLPEAIAEDWLTTPSPMLGNKTPIQVESEGDHDRALEHLLADPLLRW